MVLAGDATGTHEVLKDAVGLDHEMSTRLHNNLFAAESMDKRQFGQPTIEDMGNRLDDLAKSRRSDEHRVEDAIRRIGIRILANTSTGERAVADIHGEEFLLCNHLTIAGDFGMTRFVLGERHEECEEVIEGMTADVVLEFLGTIAAHRVHTKSDGVDEIAMVLHPISPIGDATDVEGMNVSIEELIECATEIATVDIPISPPVIAGTAGHESDGDLTPLLGGNIRTHDAIDSLGERTIATENENLIAAPLYQFARQFDGMTLIFGETIDEGLMTLLEQAPEI